MILRCCSAGSPQLDWLNEQRMLTPLMEVPQARGLCSMLFILADVSIVVAGHGRPGLCRETIIGGGAARLVTSESA